MEYASYLAGERWSDHPACTHPLLAAVARGVNDNVSDASRERLVPLVPSIVGLNGDDPLVDVGIALRCASMALPVAAHERQRALAAGILAGRRLLDDTDRVAGFVDLESLTRFVSDALASAPDATRWAEGFAIGTRPTLKLFTRRSAPSIVRLSVFGIAEACVTDRDGQLVTLLTTVIDDCQRWLSPGERPTGQTESRAPTSAALR